LLEQFVDDNASLISNISINKILPLARNKVKLRSDSSQKSGSSNDQLSIEKTVQSATRKVESIQSVSDSEESDDSDVENTTLVDGQPELFAGSNAAERVRNAGGQSTTLQSIYRKILSQRTTSLDSNERRSDQQTSERVKKYKKSPARRISTSGSEESLSQSSTEDSDDEELDSRVVDAVMKDVPVISLSITGSDPSSSAIVSARDKQEKALSDVEIKFNDNEEWPEDSIVGKSTAQRTEKNDKRQGMYIIVSTNYTVDCFVTGRCILWLVQQLKSEDYILLG